MPFVKPAALIPARVKCRLGIHDWIFLVARRYGFPEDDLVVLGQCAACRKHLPQPLEIHEFDAITANLLRELDPK